VDPQSVKKRAWLEGQAALCSVPPWRERSWRLVLLGAPGVGKGTQAALLSERLRTCHLSTGDLFRAAAARGDCARTPGLAEAIEHIRRGELVPDSLVWQMVRDRRECLRCRGGFLLDGFPRTLGQAAALEGFLEEEGLPLHAVVNYEMPLEEIVARLSGRRTCRSCQAVFHVVSHAPRVDGVCDQCGAELYQRDDDRAESIVVRMAAYRKSTMPVIDFYSGLGLVVPVSAVGPSESIFERTMGALGAHASCVVRAEESIGRR